MDIEYDKHGNIKLPRFPKNYKFRGPEYYGCCGTGRRPTILNCGGTERFIVGAESDVEQLRLEAYRSKKRTIRKGNAVVYVFKTRQPAVAKWTELCKAVTKWNEDTRNKHKADLEAARRGDTAAAGRLGDYC